MLSLIVSSRLAMASGLVLRRTIVPVRMISTTIATRTNNVVSDIKANAEELKRIKEAKLQEKDRVMQTARKIIPEEPSDQWPHQHKADIVKEEPWKKPPPAPFGPGMIPDEPADSWVASTPEDVLKEKPKEKKYSHTFVGSKILPDEPPDLWVSTKPEDILKEQQQPRKPKGGPIPSVPSDQEPHLAKAKVAKEVLQDYTKVDRKQAGSKEPHTFKDPVDREALIDDELQSHTGHMKTKERAFPFNVDTTPKRERTPDAWGQ